MAQYLKATGVDGAIVVTTPQEVSIIDVRKEINFCKKVSLPLFLSTTLVLCSSSAAGLRNSW
jgi:hypothetical protein